MQKEIVASHREGHTIIETVQDHFPSIINVKSNASVEARGVRVLEHDGETVEVQVTLVVCRFVEKQRVLEVVDGQLRLFEHAVNDGLSRHEVADVTIIERHVHPNKSSRGLRPGLVR